MPQVCIRGVGSYLPSARLTNAAIAERFGITDEHIVRLTGIRERRRAAPEEATSDMAVKAARAALTDAGLAHDAVECVIVATASPDHVTPSTANLVQVGLQLPTVPAYDLNAGCTGSLYALITATGLARAGVCGTALVVGAELVSRMVNDDDQETALVFGDGAGALVVQSGEGASGDLRVLAHSWASDGSLSEVIKVPAGGSRRPASHQTVDTGEHFPAHERRAGVPLRRACPDRAGARRSGARRPHAGGSAAADSAPGQLAHHRGGGEKTAL